MFRLFTLFAFLAPLILAQPVLPRDGPSGSLTSPAGGAYIMSIGGAGVIPISYTQVNQPNHAQTMGIDITLEPYNGNDHPAVEIAKGLSANSTSEPITGYFATLSACGEYSVVITEHQILDQYAISFRSAAPNVLISCVRLG